MTRQPRGGRGHGQPARRARVSSVRTDQPGGSRSRCCATDDTGAFSFGALPEGRYSLTASKPGYINATFGQRMPGRSGTPIQLADGQRLNVQMQIWRGGVVTGTVRRRAWRCDPQHARARDAIRLAGRAADACSRRQRPDRRSRRVSRLQLAARRLPRVRDATQCQIGGGRAARHSGGKALRLLRASRDGRRATGASNRREGAGTDPAPPSARRRAPTSDDSLPDMRRSTIRERRRSPTPSSVMVGPAEEKGGVDFQYQVVPVARIDGVVPRAPTGSCRRMCRSRS